MLDGVILLWFVLTAISVVFVAWDIRKTPEATVMKWGFVLITIYTGPLGVFLYVLGCREPLSGLHERYTAVRWRQVLGSTIHCVAGDGVGILVGAVIATFLHVTPLADIGLEYLLGFVFGWMIFQALFMREIGGGSYSRALSKTFIPELLSMNSVMAGMIPVMTLAMANVTGSHDPLNLNFWFIMSMALLAGFIFTYPINWWLVANNLKHGMMTVRPFSNQEIAGNEPDGKDHENNHQAKKSMDQAIASNDHLKHNVIVTPTASRNAIIWMTILTFALLAISLGISAVFGGL